MAEIIPLRRTSAPVRSVRSGPVIPDPVEAWMLPWSMLQLGMAAWANLWFAPLGLRVEPSRDGVRRG
jgi:hypothetical protein